MIDGLIVVMPGIVTILHAIASVAFFLKRDLPWATVYAGYALANVGLIIASIR